MPHERTKKMGLMMAVLEVLFFVPVSTTTDSGHVFFFHFCNGRNGWLRHDHLPADGGFDDATSLQKVG